MVEKDCKVVAYSVNVWVYMLGILVLLAMLIVMLPHILAFRDVEDLVVWLTLYLSNIVLIVSGVIYLRQASYTVKSIKIENETIFVSCYLGRSQKFNKYNIKKLEVLDNKKIKFIVFWKRESSAYVIILKNGKRFVITGTMSNISKLLENIIPV